MLSPQCAQLCQARVPCVAWACARARDLRAYIYNALFTTTRARYSSCFPPFARRHRRSVLRSKIILSAHTVSRFLSFFFGILSLRLSCFISIDVNFSVLALFWKSLASEEIKTHPSLNISDKRAFLYLSDIFEYYVFSNDISLQYDLAPLSLSVFLNPLSLPKSDVCWPVPGIVLSSSPFLFPSLRPNPIPVTAHVPDLPWYTSPSCASQVDSPGCSSTTISVKDSSRLRQRT